MARAYAERLEKQAAERRNDQKDEGIAHPQVA
jgi:hypothetical protein